MSTPSRAQESTHLSAAGWRSEIAQLLQHGVSDGVFPGAVLQIQRRGEVLLSEACGHRTFVEHGEAIPSMKTDTVFDVAGVTSAVVTTTLIMKLLEAGKLRLDDRVSRFVQGFGVNGKSVLTVQDLLGHTSGLVAWVPFFEELVRLNSTSRMGVLTSRGAKEYVYNVVNRSQLKYQPHSRQVYSDVGLIVLGEIIEILTGMSLDKAAQKLVLQPLGMKASSFIDLSLVKRRGIQPVLDLIAPTEECAWRKRVLCGEVHDDNAWAMGGVAGHSGLFSIAQDLGLFAAEMLRCYRGTGTFLKMQTVRGFLARPEANFDISYTLGWEVPNRDNGFQDVGFSEHAVGMTGFTGCALWLEPDKDLSIVLMSNRVHPNRSNRKIFSFRQELFRSILSAFRA